MGEEESLTRVTREGLASAGHLTVRRELEDDVVRLVVDSSDHV
jgi:hypothetical protein